MPDVRAGHRDQEQIMHLYQEFTLAAAHDRQRRFRDEAQQRRLLSAFRPARGERRARRGARGRPTVVPAPEGAPPSAAAMQAAAPRKITVAQRPRETSAAAGTLAACGPRATAPAR
ncbi:hypothetical protein GCM10009682_37640 [Luedemannella flava]|uniref:Uncharacterized protein n=1 Tax=Luedemannella flava TaxID=349316 RepID=A0ABN2MAD2_9ACTN